MFKKKTKRKIKQGVKLVLLFSFVVSYFGFAKLFGHQAQKTFATFFGGLGMFIFGMTMMSAGLQRIAGEKLKVIVTTLTDRPFYGMVTGALVTAIIQSSSATTVMTVGFVNAGIMTLKQAIGVVLGANIGTTITAQLIAFKLTDLALPVLAIGSAVFMASKTRNNRSWGEVFIGFALLFLGMKFMGDSLKLYKDHPTFHAIFVTLSQNRIYGVLAGVFVTLIVQSSSATVGLTMSLLEAGAFGDDPYVALVAAVPIVFGDNIGTCITALLSSIGTGVNAKRAAAAHAMFNVIGTILFLPFLSIYVNAIMYFSHDPVRCLANSHTAFNVINTFLFLPFVEYLRRLVVWIVPGGLDVAENPSLLDKRMLSTPPIALGQAEKELQLVSQQVRNMFSVIESVLTTEHLDEEDLTSFFSHIDGLNKEVKLTTREINKFLLFLIQKDMSEHQTHTLNRLLFLSKDYEIIANQLMRFFNIIQEIYESGDELTVEIQNELQKSFSRSKEVHDLLFTQFLLKKARAKELKTKLENSYALDTTARTTHLEMFRKGEISSAASISFLDGLRALGSLSRSLGYYIRHARGRT